MRQFHRKMFYFIFRHFTDIYVHGPTPVLQVAEHTLHGMPEEKRMEFLSRQLFPERHGSDTQPETEQLGS